MFFYGPFLDFRREQYSLIAINDVINERAKFINTTENKRAIALHCN